MSTIVKYFICNICFVIRDYMTHYECSKFLFVV